MLRKKLGMVLISLVVSLVVFEVVVRIFGVRPQIPLFNAAGPYRNDPNLMWSFKPNYEGKVHGIGVKTNSLGLRSEEISKTKLKNELRILAIGGSVTAGTDVEFSETYVEKLEENLQSKQQPNRTKKVEVINAGVPGYSPTQYVNFLKGTGLDLNPDLVILDFSINDVLEGRVPYASFQLKPEFRTNGAFLRLESNLDARTRFFNRLTDIPRYTSSYTAGRWISKKLFHRDHKNMFRWIEGELLSESPTPLVTESWNKTEVQLLEIRNLANSRGIPFAMVMFPLLEQVEKPSGIDRPQRIMKEFCDKNDIFLIDLLPILRKKQHEEKSLHFFLDADHLSAEGHRLVAQSIQEGLSSLFATLLRK